MIDYLLVFNNNVEYRLPCHRDDFMDVWQKTTSFKQQWQIKNYKIVAKQKILDDLSINRLMYRWVCDKIENSTLFNIIEHQLTQCNPIYFTIWQ